MITQLAAKPVGRFVGQVVAAWAIISVTEGTLGAGWKMWKNRSTKATAKPAVV